MSTNSYLNNESNFSSNRIVAFFPRQDAAYRAIQALRDAGYSNEEIGFIAQDDVSSYSSETDSAASGGSETHDRSFWQSVKDFFSGESHEDYDYQTHYADATGDLGWSTDRAEYYRHGIRSGGALVTVSGARSAEARRILESNGGDLRESGFDTSSFAAQRATGGQYEGQRIQLRGERLRAFKERVNRGEVRLRKEVVTDTQNISVPVTREEIVIERTPASGTTRATGDIGTDQEIRVPLSEERVRVEKQPVVKEEVRVGKRQVQRAEQVSDKVRHEELRVDKDGDVDVDESATQRKIRKDPAA